MTRILADLPDEDIKWLDARAAEQGKSRAAVLREAVSAYRAEAPKDWLEVGFGAWKDRTDIGDAVDWQRRERAFIGSNSALIAPVRIGADAIVAAGSAVSRDVADGELRLVRAEQLVKPGWADRFHDAMKKKKAETKR